MKLTIPQLLELKRKYDMEGLPSNDIGTPSYMTKAKKLYQQHIKNIRYYR